MQNTLTAPGAPRSSTRMRRSTSLAGRARLLVRIISLGLIPIVLAAVMLQWNSDRSRKRDQDAKLATVANAQHMELESYFAEAAKLNLLGSKDQAYRALYRAADGANPMTLVNAGDPVVKQVNGALANFSVLYPGMIGEACVIARNGQELARVTNGEVAPVSDLSPDESEAPFFADTFGLESGAVNQSKPYWSPDMEQWVIANSTLLPIEGMRAPAFVHFEVTVASFLARAKAMSDGQRVQVVERSTGRVIFDTDRAFSEKEAAEIGTVSKQYQSFFAGGPSKGVDKIGDDRAAWVRLDHESDSNRNDWVVVASDAPVATGFRHIDMGALLLLVVAAAGAVVIVLIKRSAGEVVERIERLADVAERGALDSSADVQAGDGRDDEIGRLGAAFDEVVGAIRDATTTAGEIAQGNLAVDATPRNDGDDLNRAFAKTVEYLREMAHAAERIAIGDVDVKIASRGEQDVLANSFADMSVYLRRRIEDADRIARGDLATRPEPVSDVDRLGRALGQMVDDLRTSMTETSEAAQTLAGSAEQLVTTSGEVETGMRMVAERLTAIADGSQQQITLVSQTGTEIEAAHEVVDEARGRIVHARGSAGDASLAMRELADVSGSVTEAIRDLSRRSERIGEIVGTITGIAEQTNLLALNAAIEAARAGEHGSGFAVVADEVRKLAEESRDAAELIASIIGQIQEETERTVTVVQDANERTAGGVELVGATTAALGDIEHAVTDVAERIRRMQDAFVQVSEVAQAGADSVEQVSAASQQTAASMEEVALAAQELEALGEQLVTSASRYEAGASDDHAHAGPLAA